MDEKKENELDKKLVIVFLILAMLFAIMFCFLEYCNQTRKIYFSLEPFEKTDKEEMARIIEITETEKYFKIEGQVMTDVKSYKLDIGIENAEGKIEMYRTQYDNSNNGFLAVIPKEDVQGEKTIYIAYMCNNQNVLIKTSKTVGETCHE